MVGSNGALSLFCTSDRFLFYDFCREFCSYLHSHSGTEEPAIVTKMNLTLSADHRVFDGKVGGE